VASRLRHPAAAVKLPRAYEQNSEPLPSERSRAQEGWRVTSEGRGSEPATPKPLAAPVVRRAKATEPKPMAKPLASTLRPKTPAQPANRKSPVPILPRKTQHGVDWSVGQREAFRRLHVHLRDNGQRGASFHVAFADTRPAIPFPAGPQPARSGC
jgi:hypothetical protein